MSSPQMRLGVMDTIRDATSEQAMTTASEKKQPLVATQQKIRQVGHGVGERGVEDGIGQFGGPEPGISAGCRSRASA